MTDETSDQTRRRIDRVVADDFLDGLADRSVDEVRVMRDECREEEARLSYARRLLQARLDIVRAEAARRAEGSDAEGGLLDALPGILADDPLPSTLGGARSTPVYDPDPREDGGRRLGDGVLGDAALGRIPGASDEELVALVERTAEEERRVSEVRRTVLDRLDALQAELIGRYRSGSVDVDAIVSAAVGGGGRPRG